VYSCPSFPVRDPVVLEQMKGSGIKEIFTKQNERQQQAAASTTPTTKQEDEDKDKIIADLKNENETLKRQVKEAQDIFSGLVNTGMSDHYLGHTGMTVRQLAEKWGLVETKTTSNAKPKRKDMIESMLGAYKRAHPDEQLP
jgi:hypothetical protein